MNEYRVLWIDNDYDKLDAIQIEMEQADLDITCCKTAKEGIEYLRKKLYYWDGVILDAKVFNETEHETDTLAGMTRVINAVSELKATRYIPLFILTGQPDTKGNQAFDEILKGHGLKAYSKNTEREKLYSDLKDEADKLPETQLRHKYSDLFINGIDERILLDILTILDQNAFRDSEVFNKTRLLFECTIPICKEVGLIGAEISKTERAKDSLKASDEVPLHIKYILDSFVTSSQDGSHYEKLLKDVNDGKCPYIVAATINGLLSYLIWLERFRKGEKTK